jgi:hypothetical protein
MTAKSIPIMCGNLPSPARVNPPAPNEGGLAEDLEADAQRETLLQAARARLVENGATRSLPLLHYLNIRALSLATETQLRCFIDLARE